jgi:hypothetical protein
LHKCFNAISAQSNPEHIKDFTGKNSRKLLNL